MEKGGGKGEATRDGIEELIGRRNIADEMAICAEKVSTVISEFIRQKVAEKGKNGVALGLSGGLDSAVTAVLATRAIGASNVYALHLFDRDSQSRFREYAHRLADRLGIHFEAVDITQTIKAKQVYRPLVMKAVPYSPIVNRLVIFPMARLIYRLVFGESPFLLTLRKGETNKHTFTKIIHSAMAGAIDEGIKIRHIERREILDEYAQERNLLLIGAANRSESFVGLFVKDGVDDLPVEPLLGLYKTQVRQLAGFLQVPQAIMDESPSPDMFKGIRDEDLLGVPYDKIDKVAYIIEHGIVEDVSSSEGITLDELDAVRTLHTLSAWKRENEHEYPCLSQPRAYL